MRKAICDGCGKEKIAHQDFRMDIKIANLFIAAIGGEPEFCCEKCFYTWVANPKHNPILRDRIATGSTGDTQVVAVDMDGMSIEDEIREEVSKWMYSDHYHCKDCGAIVKFLKRLDWESKTGGTAVGSCDRCGLFLNENEKTPRISWTNMA